uniref:E3 ubiquitin-protein ligase DDB_G0292642-like n=1 Tax=Pristiophorus japonicus TaxID=55135 RepID=UPI00398ECA8F
MTDLVPEKRYDPKDSTLKFVNRKDEITGDDDPDVLRVEMSCGHAVDPNSLTGWCRSLIDQGHFTFHCPAEKEGTKEKCNKLWPYVEVRRHALLTDEEQQYFEEKVATLAAAKYCEYKWCPGCKSCVERKNLTNLSVRCSICMAEKGKCYEFCWQCMKEWKGRAPRSDRCDNEGCTNLQLDTLKNCDTKVIDYSKIQSCPKIRACPTCGVLIEHKEMCKYVMCIRCHVEFCFVCLQTKAICSKLSNYATACAKPMAPRQTSIPVWNRS